MRCACRPARGEATRPGQTASSSSSSARPTSARIRAETSTASATGGLTSSLAVFVVLCRAVDRRDPLLAALHPHLGFRRQVERRLIEASEPDLYQRVVGADRVQQPRTTAAAKAATLEARNLAGDLARVHGPLRVHGEGASGFLPAVPAVAAPDMYRLAANGVPHCPAEASTGAHGRLHRAMLCA